MTRAVPQAAAAFTATRAACRGRRLRAARDEPQARRRRAAASQHRLQHAQRPECGTVGVGDRGQHRRRRRRRSAAPLPARRPPRRRPAHQRRSARGRARGLRRRRRRRRARRPGRRRRRRGHWRGSPCQRMQPAERLVVGRWRSAPPTAAGGASSAARTSDARVATGRSAARRTPRRGAAPVRQSIGQARRPQPADGGHQTRAIRAPRDGRRQSSSPSGPRPAPIAAPTAAAPDAGRARRRRSRPSLDQARRRCRRSAPAGADCAPSSRRPVRRPRTRRASTVE